MISAIFYWTDNSNFVGAIQGFGTVKKPLLIAVALPVAVICSAYIDIYE
jgi:hypothetical protein